MASRFIPNDFSSLLSLGDTAPLLQDAVEDIITEFPPLDAYHANMLSGLWSGPTGIAYLLLHVGQAHPHLKIAGHHAQTWARAYLKGTRSFVHLESRHCGIGSEELAFDAVRAALTKDFTYVRTFVEHVPAIVHSDNYPNELLYGRAGTLYLLRLMRQWVPDAASLVDDAITRVAQKIITDGLDWTWHGKRYLGAMHGDIGIVTQLVLTTPGLASQLQPKLEGLLDMQCPDGNWPSSEGKDMAEPLLTQVCHGAPGFVHSLVALRPYFPRLGERIDHAIQKGRECIWREGLLRKEPSLCHGIFGNALALPPGPQRDHFLAFATRKKVAEMRSQEPSIFERADYGERYSMLAGYVPSAAWTWMVRAREPPGIMMYNDV